MLGTEKCESLPTILRLKVITEDLPVASRGSPEDRLDDAVHNRNQPGTFSREKFSRGHRPNSVSLPLKEMPQLIGRASRPQIIPSFPDVDVEWDLPQEASGSVPGWLVEEKPADTTRTNCHVEHGDREEILKRDAVRIVAGQSMQEVTLEGTIRIEKEATSSAEVS
jgi:hypothetical protein